VYHSTLGLRVLEKNKEDQTVLPCDSRPGACKAVTILWAILSVPEMTLLVADQRCKPLRISGFVRTCNSNFPLQCIDVLKEWERLFLSSNTVARFRGGLVFKSHRLCVSLDSRLESNKEEEEEEVARWASQIGQCIFGEVIKNVRNKELLSTDI